MKEEFITAVEQLKQWIIQNKVIFEEKKWKDGTEVIEVEHLTFNANLIDEDEVIEIRALTKNILPESYYYFLSEIGSGQFFIGKYLPSFEIYSLAELLEYNNLIQQELKEAASDEFFMIGVHSSMGDWIGFCTSKKDVKNFDVYTHEYPIGEYVETSNELNSWRSFEEWVIKAISTKGQKAL